MIVLPTLPNNHAKSNFNCSFTMELLSLLTDINDTSVIHFIIFVINKVIFVLDIKTTSVSRNQSALSKFGDVGIFTPIFQEQICNTRTKSASERSERVECKVSRFIQSNVVWLCSRRCQTIRSPIVLQTAPHLHLVCLFMQVQFWPLSLVARPRQ